jgi:hypothetical protein
MIRSRCTIAKLLADHLVRAQHEAGGYFVPNRLGGLEADHQLELGRSLP